MDVCLHIPAFSVDPMKAGGHSQALQKIAEAGGTVRNKNTYLKMKVYNKYCHVLKAYFESPLVVSALKANYQPLFIFKNVEMRHTHYPTPHCELCTHELTAKSVIFLAGFYNWNRQNESEFQLISISDGNGKLCMAKMQQGRVLGAM